MTTAHVYRSPVRLSGGQRRLEKVSRTIAAKYDHEKAKVLTHKGKKDLIAAMLRALGQREPYRICGVLLSSKIGDETLDRTIEQLENRMITEGHTDELEQIQAGQESAQPRQAV